MLRDEPLRMAATPPGPDPSSFSSLCAAQPDPLAFLRELRARHGDTLQYQTPYGPCFLFNDPDQARTALESDRIQRTPLIKAILGEGLLASDGPPWLRRRRLLNESFREARVLAFAGEVGRAARELGERLAVAAGRPVDVGEEMTRLSLAVALRALFGVEPDAETPRVRAAITALLEAVGELSLTALNAPHRVAPGHNQRVGAALATIDAFAYRLIEERRALAVKPDDLLSFLVGAREHESGRPLGDRQLRDELVSMLVAGHEATALMLTWSWYELGRNPAAAARLEAELDAVLDGREPTAEDLPRLDTTRRVLLEALRLHPPIWFICRQAAASTAVADCAVPAGALVAVSPYLVQRHPAVWSEPDRFDPERFERGEKGVRPRPGFIPFGAGRHTCLGLHMGLMEGQVALASIAQRFRLLPATERAIAARPVLTLRPVEPYLAHAEPRAAAAP